MLANFIDTFEQYLAGAALCAIFSTSAVGKCRGFAAWRDSLSELARTSMIRIGLAIFIVMAEVVIVVVSLTAPPIAALWFVAVFLVAVTTYLATKLGDSRILECQCWGRKDQRRSTELSASILRPVWFGLRNSVIMATSCVFAHVELGVASIFTAVPLAILCIGLVADVAARSENLGRAGRAWLARSLDFAESDERRRNLNSPIWTGVRGR